MSGDGQASSFDDVFAERMMNIPRSFLREILKVAIQPGMISLAGGLPNKDLFPTQELRAATNKVFEKFGPDPLQYSNSEGLAELREYIANHYAKRGIQGVKPENILITTGSQQALDLLGKILINKGDGLILEEPSYLGAIQALAIYQPRFLTVPLHEDGLDTDKLREALKLQPKLMYLIPNFQNPSGLSYTDENRKAVADLVRGTRTYLIEDDPYGELRFSGTPKTSFMNLIPEQTILLGTFSKTVIPGFRIGWAVVPEELSEKLLIAKQAADLHTSSFLQRVIYQYLADNDPAAHIAKIIERYATQKNAMIEAIGEYFPKSVTYTNPEGGMFLWATLPNGLSAMKLFELAVADGVCVVPGYPFYVNQEQVSTVRLSFSCVERPTIFEAIKRLGKAAHQLCDA